MIEASGSIVDASIWTRMSPGADVQWALARLLDEVEPSRLWVLPHTAASIAFAADTLRQHSTLAALFMAFGECPLQPSITDLMSLQERLWDAGFAESVTATATLTAAYAVANDATVLHADEVFESIGFVIPELRQARLVTNRAA